MNSNKCSNCELDKYLGEDKCIFHCDKTQKNGWIVSNYDIDRDSPESKKTKWNDKKVQEFWREFNFYATDYTVFKEFKFPIYWKTQYSHVSILENSSSEVKFESCTFLDYFYLDNNIQDKNNVKKSTSKKYRIEQKNNSIPQLIEIEESNQNYLKLSFLRSTFHSLLHLKSLSLESLFLLDNKHKHNNIELYNLVITNNSEICRSENINQLFISEMNHREKFEIWNNELNNISLEVGTYANLQIRMNKVKEFSLWDLNLQKMKIQKQNIDYSLNNIKLNNLEFEEDSRILFENISCKNFELKKLSQDSKFIQFDHVEVENELTFSQNEFKNTYFNDFNISTATKTIVKTSFIDSHLNSIQWGKISEISASKDIFRQLKFVNDSQANYINANSFYVMEMNAHEKELKKKLWVSNFWQDKLIFFLGKKISNHSQSWFLPLLWILLSSLVFYAIAFLFKIDDFEISSQKSLWVTVSALSSIIIGRIIYEFGILKKKNLYIFIHIVPIITFIVIIMFCHLGSMDDFVKFMGLKPPEEFESVLIWWLINKIVTGFLAYHFVIALRRQTKR